MGALHIRYTEYRAPVRTDPILQLRTEVEEEAEDDHLLILLRHTVVVDERRLVREVTDVLDAPHEVVRRLDLQRERRAGEVLSRNAGCPRRALRVVEILESRDDRDILVRLVFQIAGDALGRGSKAADGVRR